MFCYSLMLALGAMTALGIEHRAALYKWYLDLLSAGTGA